MGSLKKYQETWRGVNPWGNMRFEVTIRGAMDLARGLGRDLGVYLLVMGSRHLLGGALHPLEMRKEGRN